MQEEKIKGLQPGWKVSKFPRRCLSSEQFVEEAGNEVQNNVGNRENQKV